MRTKSCWSPAESRHTRNSIGGSALLAASIAFLVAPAFGANPLDKEIKLDIAPNTSLDAALIQWGTESGIQVMIATDVVSRQKTDGVKGVLRAGDALTRLLQDTGLSYSAEGKTVAVVPASPARKVSTDAPRPTAQATEPLPPRDAGSQVEEVVVTAQKRSERLQDVPLPIGVVTGEALANNNQLRIQDFYSSVPGVSIGTNPSGPQTFLTIRGLATGGASSVNPTVSVMVDDTPYGSATGLGGGGFGAPDIDPGDLQRVEVLRGPQGTLYGASSIGGLVKFVTIEPSTDRLSGRVQLGASGVEGGDGVGYSVRGSVNVPVSDTFAVRASAYKRREPGYIRDPGLGLDGLNETDSRGGQLSALWRASDTVSLRFNALLQNTDLDGSPYSLPTLEQHFPFRDQRSESRLQAYSVTLNATLGAAQLTAVSGYGINDVFNLADYTGVIGAARNQTQFGVPGTGTGFTFDYNNKKFSEEIRATFPIGERFDGLVGVFYTHESSPNFNRILAIDPATTTSVGEWVYFDLPSAFTQYAAFADLTVKFTDRFDVQFGGRQSSDELVASTNYVGPYDPVFLNQPSPITSPQIRANSDTFTYLVTPRLRISPDLMLYARFASGYRPGGPNTSSTALGVPTTFEPDEVTTYELGFKGEAFDRMLSIDASLYYIDWQDLQIRVREPVSRIAYYVNSGSAKSQGAELTLGVRAPFGLNVTAWGSWNDAVLTEAFPAIAPTYGANGDRLPYASRRSGNLSLDKEFSLFGSAVLTVGGAVSYVGDRIGLFQGRTGTGAPLPRQVYPSYVKTDVRASLRYDTWLVSLYANNVANKRGALDGGLGNIDPTLFVYMQPRTIGLSLAKTF